MRVGINRNSDRRSFLKALGTSGAVVAAAGAGLLKPVRGMAANFSYPKKAFNKEGMDAAMQAAMGTTSATEGSVSLDAPTIAENGAVVPITISSDKDVAKFHLFVEKNPAPYTARFHMLETGRSEVSARIKMGETSNIIAVAETTDGQFFKKTKEVRVTIGGCGG